MHDIVIQRFNETCPKVDFCSLRLVDETTERIHVRQGQLEPITHGSDVGIMVTVVHNGGLGYAATPDLTLQGMRRAFDQAQTWAQLSAQNPVTNYSEIYGRQPTSNHDYETPAEQPWGAHDLGSKIALLQDVNDRLAINDKIVDRQAWLTHIDTYTLYIDSAGSCIRQHLKHIAPGIQVVANDGTETQRRSFQDQCQQGGLEILENIGFAARATPLANDAVALLSAPNCPSGSMPLLLTPDQMMLQIHESIGHPLELDRILGDERNYAGTSFVTPEMFGTYQYGSELLNVRFEPEHSGEFASYQYDDDGTAAKDAKLIDRGILKRGLGGVISQHRAGIEGVSSTRAASWNRPPIDRMANLNIDPGTTEMAAMIGQVERGVLMSTNSSWSIDDSRNKFQFGCEYGRMIEEGELTHLVKNPNYRGISATFWRNLKAVGTKATAATLGTPYCGKGEPNQIIRVGHASPACLFADVDVFGGE